LESEALNNFGGKEVPKDEVAVLVPGQNVVGRRRDGSDAVAHRAKKERKNENIKIAPRLKFIFHG
jgi:pyruvate/oxaloacetate carboxyltransferase